jgi:hypothetical protein
MSFVPSVTDSAIFTALRTFLLAILPAGTDVVQGQANRVPEVTAADFVVATPGRRVRLSTTAEEWDPAAVNPVAIAMTAPTQVEVQVDVHGPNSSDNVQTIRTLFRSSYGVTAFPENIVPLFIDDPMQAPFENEAKQIETRWVVKVQLQVNPAVSTPMQFADTLAVNTQPPADSGAS